MEAKIASRPAFTAIGLKYRGKNENKEIPPLADVPFHPDPVNL